MAGGGDVGGGGRRWRRLGAVIALGGAVSVPQACAVHGKPSGPITSTDSQ